MSPELLTLLMFAALLFGILLGFPSAFVLGGLAMIFGLIFIGPSVFFLFIMRIYGLMKDYILLAVPLFLFMGVFMEHSGTAERLFSALYVCLGGLKGGLAVATIILATLFAATTGMVGASEVTIGILAIPAMLKRKYDKSLACGTICAGGTLGILIPPSIMIILYGPLAGLSVGKLMLAAFVPGFLLSALYITYIVVRCHFCPEDGPSLAAEEMKVPLKGKVVLLLTAIGPVFLIIMAVLGSIFLGITSVTESAAMGAISAMILAFFYGRLDIKTIKSACLNTLQITSMILMLAVGASFFTLIFTALGGGDVVKNLLINLPLEKNGVLLVMMAIILVMGSFIDWMGILMICVPIFTPIAEVLEFHPIWFATLIIVNLQMSFLTPPFAYSIFYLKGIAPPEIKTTDIYKGVTPFILLQCIGLTICIMFPQIITYWPDNFLK